MKKTCENCHFCYEYPDGRKECNGTFSDYPEIVESGCAGFMPRKTLEECVEEATPKWVDVDPKEYIDDVRGVPRWHDAESDDLPPIDEEVIALDKRGRISFAHRPNPKGFDGTSLSTGKRNHYIPELYGKGGWNWDGVRWWMPCPEIPKEK